MNSDEILQALAVMTELRHGWDIPDRSLPPPTRTAIAMAVFVTGWAVKAGLQVQRVCPGLDGEVDVWLGEAQRWVWCQVGEQLVKAYLGEGMEVLGQTASGGPITVVPFQQKIEAFLKAKSEGAAS